MMILNKHYGSFICRGRRKKFAVLLIMLLLLINAMLYMSLELYNTIKWKRSHTNEKRFNHEDYNKGMKVIVGHYVGGNSGGNLSEEIVNSNHYSPKNHAGENGNAVTLLAREMALASELYALHSYNIVAGDQIPINRSLPDMRSESCRSVKYDLENLPSASVIIVFHNEAWSTLMRTVMSVVNRSPSVLLKEIILVDDASERKYLFKELDDAVANLNNVKILRSSVRSGLVGARMRGARAALGDVLVFLDAHCEVTEGWLEPLLDRAGSDDVFICPHIDIISDDSFGYSKTVVAHWGAFNWRLHFRWLLRGGDVIENQSKNKPYSTPVMSGGLFAVRKSLFWHLGGYDEGMMIWGAENLELSWRAWQCGAKVEITSCSRVGHIFRKHSPYKFPGGVGKVLYSNLARAASVWMDEWGEFFFKFNPSIAELRDTQNLADRLEIRKKLKCKSFKWYLENVWPQHFFPTDQRWFGRIRSDKGGCVGVTDPPNGLHKPATPITCGSDLDLDRLVVYTLEGKIMANEALCLEQENEWTYWKTCTDTIRQIWQQKGPRLIHIDGRCLTVVPYESQYGNKNHLTSKSCIDDASQIWHFERVPWH